MPQAPADLDPASIRFLSFDCYGTIVDWERGILDVLRPWADEAAGLAKRVDDDALLAAFAASETVVQAADPAAAYPEILRRTALRIAETLGLPGDEILAVRLGASVGDWPPFGDSRKALERLAAHAPLIVLSNVDATSFENTRLRQLGGLDFARVVTAQQVGAYKPAEPMFHALLDAVAELGGTPDQLVHVGQSRYHDIEPAARLGLRTVWVDRRAGAAGGATPAVEGDAHEPTLTVRTLAELADALGL